MYMEFKKFSVRVINDVGGPISIGMNISLINKEPRILSDIGVIETFPELSDFLKGKIKRPLI